MELTGNTDRDRYRNMGVLLENQLSGFRQDKLGSSRTIATLT